MLSGRFGSPFGDYPAIGAVVAHETGFTRHAAAVRRGAAQSVVHLGTGQERVPRRALRVVQDRRPEPAELQGAGRGPGRAADRAKRSSAAATLLEAVDGLAKKVEGNDQIATYDEFRQRAAAMVLSGEARSAFAIDAGDRAAPRPLRPQHVRPELPAGPPAGRGRRAVRHRQLRRLGPPRQDLREPGQEAARSSTAGFSALIEDMDDARPARRHAGGVHGRVRPDAEDQQGRRPRPLGPGRVAAVRRGRRAGRAACSARPTSRGRTSTQRPVGPADVAYTIFDALGIDPRKQLVTPDGRPIEILDQGELVKELF